MLNIGLSKPYPFDPLTVDQIIKLKAAGNFALGELNDSGEFAAEYVGWSDSDIKTEIKAMLGGRYSAFEYSYALTAKDAFEKNCRIFHDLGGQILLDNKEHPTRPHRAKWRCPLCDIY